MWKRCVLIVTFPDTFEVSEELSSVETQERRRITAYYALFQKNLVVWKQTKDIMVMEEKWEFQKNLVVWKLLFCIFLIAILIPVSEELSSVETCFQISIPLLYLLRFRRT